MSNFAGRAQRGTYTPSTKFPRFRTFHLKPQKSGLKKFPQKNFKIFNELFTELIKNRAQKMNIQRSLLAIIRVINQLRKQEDFDGSKGFAKMVIQDLTDDQKQNLIDMLKAMTLLTSGSVSLVRDPSKWANVGQPWFDIFSGATRNLIQTINPQFPLDQPPQRSDYELAKKLLPHMGQSFVSADDFDETGVPVDDDDELLGYQTLYRGLKNLTPRTVKWILTSPDNWNIERAVSTSISKEASENFAGMTAGQFGSTEGPAVLLTISNPNRKGFVADQMSKYEHEQEVILSGVCRIYAWSMEINGSLEQYKSQDNGGWSMDSYRTQLIVLSGRNTFIFTKQPSRASRNDQSDSIFPLSFTIEDDAAFVQMAQNIIEGRKLPMPRLDELTADDSTWRWTPRKNSVAVRANAIIH